MATDGTELAPLTVRDLASRQVLAVRLLAAPSERAVRAALTRLFRRHGLPRALWTDNGAPFARSGPLGLSHLSAWWRRLAVRVEFSRLGCPQDNAAHEQMHRVLKAETMQPCAANAAAQQRRYDRWRHDYNQRRPHEALQMRVPAASYHSSRRRLPAALPPLRYPLRWAVVQIGRNGRATWQGRVRLFGRAFAGERLGLRPRPDHSHEVYFGSELIGTLHSTDRAGLRPARRVAPQSRGEGGATPPPSTHPSLL
jgi:putative transposase